jgi:hypothetical protein
MSHKPRIKIVDQSTLQNSNKTTGRNIMEATYPTPRYRSSQSKLGISGLDFGAVVISREPYHD